MKMHVCLKSYEVICHERCTHSPSQVRDREYTQQLLEKVAEAHRQARARAERFGVEYVEVGSVFCLHVRTCRAFNFPICICRERESYMYTQGKRID